MAADGTGWSPLRVAVAGITTDLMTGRLGWASVPEMSAALWAASLLGMGGWPATPNNVRAIVAWEKAEGGHWNNSAKYNPLNTTQPMPGAGNTGTQGNIKVYRSWQQGLEASVKTINNGNYPQVVAALKRGNNAPAVARAIGASPWGTKGGLLSSTLASTPSTAVPISGVETAGTETTIGLGLLSDNSLEGTVSDGANSIKDAAMAIPDFLSKLAVVFQGGFWLRMGKIILGLAALIGGAVFIGKQFAVSQTVKGLVK